MLRGNRVEELKPVEARRDTEFTLGPAMLIGMVCGLALLCGLCFGIGYSAGRRSGGGNAATVTQTATGETVIAPPGGSLTKPTAESTMPTAAAPQAAAEVPPANQTNQTDGGGAVNAPTSNAPAVSGPSVSGPSAGGGSQLQVHPALPQNGGPAANSAAGGGVQQAAAQGPGVMVQIAAVSHAEDATVLVNALRKRGYAVTARRQLGDELIHVQIGPFTNRSEANAMSSKLLSDGYNAVVMP
jgi:cell division septation protein DedD